VNSAAGARLKTSREAALTKLQLGAVQVQYEHLLSCN
jgi:hypothetical protein